MTTCAGVYNTGLVPPFPSIGKNEDGTFGALLSMAVPAARFAHLPVGIVHDSDRPPTRLEPALRSAQETRLSEVLTSWLGDVPRGGQTPSDWFVRASAALIHHGRLTPTALEAAVIRAARTRRRRELAHAARICEATDLAAHYRTALTAYRDTLAASLLRPDFFVPVEFRACGSRADAYEALGAAVVAFGDMMGAWPGLWSRARARNAQRGRQAAGDG
jgi:hypothetical protein